MKENLYVFLRKWIYPLLLTLEIWGVRILRWLPGQVRPHSVMIIPPYSPGSLGDEAILTSGARALRDRGLTTMGIIRYQHGDDWSYLGTFADTLDMEDYFIHLRWKDHFRFVWVVRRYRYCLFFGTDVMDGFYGEEGCVRRIRLAGLAARCGVKTSIAGFSFSDKATQGSIQALRDLPVAVSLFSRDPVSFERLTRQVDHAVELVADVAFLLEPETSTPLVRQASEWIAAQKAGGKVVAGFNVSMHLIKQVPALTPEALVVAHREAIVEMVSSRPDLRFVLLPHDTREEFHDGVLIQAVMETLPPEVRACCLAIPSSIHAAEIKAICGQLDLALSGRMHMAIACLGQGTPVACITYQGKFEGLYRHFALDGLMIDPVTATQPGRLAAFFLPVIDRREAIRRQIQSQLPKVRALAAENFRLARG